MNVSDTYTLTEILSSGVAGLLCLILILQRFIAKFKTQQAETTVIDLMHTELERLSEQNTKLSLELGKLQEELMNLNTELRVLTTENQRLHTEVERLTTEIAKFKELALANKRE